jgi:hypothetical protein
VRSGVYRVSRKFLLKLILACEEWCVQGVKEYFTKIVTGVWGVVYTGVKDIFTKTYWSVRSG